MNWRKETDIAYRKFERDIDRAVAKLSGRKCCENFGDKEIREIGDKWSDYLSGNWSVVGRFVERYNQFKNWCYNYTGGENE